MESIIAKEIYGNYHVYGPDGKWMFATSERKYKWYLNKNLAEVIGDKEIRLTFAPKGKGNGGKPFFLQNHLNRCVCCGATDNLTKHHVVPACYRKHLPDEQKEHNMHDVLLLCWDCHENYEREADKLKETLRLETGVVYANFDRKKIKIKMAANLLLNNGKRYELPDEKYQKTKKFVAEYLKKDEFNEDDLFLLRDQAPIADPSGKTEGELVVKKQTDILAFVKRWREHFLKFVNPQYLPAFWDVNFQRTE